MKVITQGLPDTFDAKKVAATVTGLPEDEVVRDAADVFKALANPTRIRIMHALAHDELCVGDLARALGLSMSALSHQLALLRRMKLLSAREDGRQTFYRVVDRFVGDLVHDCLAHAEAVGKVGKIGKVGDKARSGHRHPHGRRT